MSCIQQAAEKAAKPRHFFVTRRRKCVYGGKVHRRKRKGDPVSAGERRRLYSLHSVRDPWSLICAGTFFLASVNFRRARCRAVSEERKGRKRTLVRGECSLNAKTLCFSRRFHRYTGGTLECLLITEIYFDIEIYRDSE